MSQYLPMSDTLLYMSSSTVAFQRPKDDQWNLRDLVNFYAKHASPVENIWSNDRPIAVKNYKIRKFMKAGFIQYTLTRREHDYVRTQADFPSMNLEEVFLIAKVFQHKSEKHPKMKIALERANTFLKETVCDDYDGMCGIWKDLVIHHTNLRTQGVNKSL